MASDEYEVSFVVPFDGAASIIDGIRNRYKNSGLVDYYITPNCRIREQIGESYNVNTKRGDKGTGHRVEAEYPISMRDPSWLNDVSKLTVRKDRTSWEEGKLKMSVDVVHTPMKIGIVEIETSDKKLFDKIKRVVGELVDCPLNAWSYFRRKVAIVGGPSSGKTSTAKAISLQLNNEYGANSSDVVEYATSFIQKSGHPPTFEDQPWIQLKQSERENTVASTTNIVISDCPPFLAYIYAARALRSMDATDFTDYTMQALYKRAVKSLGDYYTFILLKTLEYKENNVRFHNKEQSNEIYSEIKRFIVDHGRAADILDVDYTEKEQIINKILYMNAASEVGSFLDIWREGSGLLQGLDSKK